MESPAPVPVIAPTPVIVTPPPQQPVHEEPVATHTKPFGPVIFFIGVGLTAVAGGLTIASGIQTVNSPGSAKVQQDCAGQGDSCAEYQTGRSEQLRTNILLGATIGLGALTIVDWLFFTQWSHPKQTAKASIEPYFGGASHGGTLGLHGAF